MTLFLRQRVMGRNNYNEPKTSKAQNTTYWFYEEFKIQSSKEGSCLRHCFFWCHLRNINFSWILTVTAWHGLCWLTTKTSINCVIDNKMNRKQEKEVLRYVSTTFLSSCTFIKLSSLFPYQSSILVASFLETPTHQNGKLLASKFRAQLIRFQMWQTYHKTPWNNSTVFNY